MTDIINTIDHCGGSNLLYGEWLATNGLGGFASGTLSGAPTRKYHAYLISSLPSPYGRTVFLNYVEDTVTLPDKREVCLSDLQFVDKKTQPQVPLKEFRLENGFPIWRYEFDGIVVEKTLFLVHKQNTVRIRYRLVSAQEPIEIRWKPFLHFRLYEQAVNFSLNDESYTVFAKDQKYEVHCPGFPPLRLYTFRHAPFTINTQQLQNVYYEIEERRGYASIGNLTSPGFYSASISPGEVISFIASTDPWEAILALPSDDALRTERIRRKKLVKNAESLKKPRNATEKKLILAADQFIITPNGRYEDMVRLQAAGEEVRTIIAGYPWFTDWGRDTMISLEGLTMSTGRFQDAHSILRTFAHYVKDGLIPNMFPDGEKVGLYHTADATLWFFHALQRYLDYTQDEDILEFLLPKFHEIIQHHIHGTRFGIKADSDGLLMQGQKEYQLTWMDAKVGDWVVTPRRGKSVEINALWYNALKLYETWSGKTLEITQKCYESFNKRFWYEKGQYLYDVVDGEQGDDPALRPNQLFAISLLHPVLEESKWKPVIDIVHKDLLTPYGLRTLSPSHPDYKAFYDGDLRARDAAYHQGTVWPWLLGPFIDVWLKVYPKDLDSAQKFLQGLEEHLNKNCLGTIGEIFDAKDPYHARGCFAQAWSVAEFLRSLMKVNKVHVNGV